MLTREEIIAFFGTEEGKLIEKEIITNYIQENPDGKALMDELIGPELSKAKQTAVTEWENTGKGKNLKDHNKRLMDEIQSLKGQADEGRKLQSLLDLSGISDYNSLEEAVLSFKKDGSQKTDDEVISLKKDLQSYRVKVRDFEARLPALEKENNSLQAAIQDSDSFIAKMLINSQIKSALVKHSFSEYQAEGLVSRIAELGKFHVEIDEISKDRRAVNEFGLSPEDYTVKEYLTTEEGKSFLPNKATGGGARGDQTPGASRAKSLKDMTWTERQELMVKDPKRYQELKRASKN
ncbi:MAG: hypothetical protein ACFFDN_02475 [Candidatus Hodarchaeota archaeon]